MKQQLAWTSICVALMAALASLACGQAPSASPTAAPVALTPTGGTVATASPSYSGGAPQGFTIYFIDVGQGDATLIVASTGESLLVDGGRSQTLIRDRLRAMGVTDLDAVAMTHPDADHIGGLIEVLEIFPVERIYLNGGDSISRMFSDFMRLVRAEGAEVDTVRRGDAIPLGSLSLKVLHPGSLTGDSNEDSMVLLLDCGEVEVLLTGDAEVPSERDMLRAGVLSDIDVLKVGHHGSRTSTSEDFLDAVRPEVGIISAARQSPYGHPHPEVLARLEAASVKVMLTDTGSGADTIVMKSDCQRYEFASAG